MADGKRLISPKSGNPGRFGCFMKGEAFSEWEKVGSASFQLLNNTGTLGIPFTVPKGNLASERTATKYKMS
ncbi:hypothetical protein J6590_090839 [Homalodisca vitripennis]|nr:hypothetical protein J6590_090839 [Homalodisca vitripennis]